MYTKSSIAQDVHIFVVLFITTTYLCNYPKACDEPIFHYSQCDRSILADWLLTIYIYEFYHHQLLSNYTQAYEEHCAYFQSCKECNFSWLDREMVYISYPQG